MDLGTLWGELALDDGPFATALQDALAGLTDFSGKGVAIAGAAGVAVAAAFGASVMQGMQLDAAQDRVAAQLGLTEEQSARAGRVAGKAYADNYGESLEQVNQATGVVMGSIRGMREASEAELQKVTEAALTFSDVMEVDITRASQVAGQMLTQGLAKDATQAFDLLTLAAQKVPPALREDLIDAIDEYGPMFAQLGYTGEEAFSLLVDSSAKGMYGIDKAGDAIKEFTIRSTDMSTASKDAYKAIGLDANTMANDILKGGDRAKSATDKIINGILGIKDPATRANTAIALFGTPLEDLGTNDIPKFLKSLKGSSDAMDGFSGSTARASDTLGGNSLATLEKWKRSAQMAFMGLADWAIPAIDDTVRSLDAMLDPLGGGQRGAAILAGVIGAVLVPALIVWGVQSTIAGVKAAAAWTMAQWGAIRAAAAHAVSVAGIVAGWLLMGATATASALRTAAAWTLGFVVGAAVAVASMAVSVATVVAGWILMGAQAMAQAVRMAAAWLIALGPIGWVIAAVIALVALVVAKWDWIKSKTVAIWGALVNFVKAAPGKIAAFFMNWSLPGLIIKHWDSIKRAFSNGVDRVVSLVSGLKGKVTSAISGATTWLIGVGQDIMRGLVSGIENGFAWVRDKLSGVGRAIPGWLQNVLGISSPSRVMRDEVGQWIPAGVAEGITRGTPQVRSAVEAMGAVATRSLLTSASVGVVGSVTGSAPLAAGPFGGLSGAVDATGNLDLSDRSLRALTAMILDGSEHVAGKATSRKELQDKLAAAMPRPSAAGGLS